MKSIQPNERALMLAGRFQHRSIKYTEEQMKFYTAFEIALRRRGFRLVW